MDGAHPTSPGTQSLHAGLSPNSSCPYRCNPRVPFTSATPLLRLRGSLPVLPRNHDARAARPRLWRVLGQLARDRDKELVHVGRRLRARLHEEDAVVARIRLRLLRLHLALGRQVRLVARKRNHDVWVALPLQLLHPLLPALERVPVCDVVHDDCCSSAPVVHGRERVVPLLAGRVPNLKLDGRVVERDRLRQKRSADGGLLVLEELPAHKAQHKRALPDCAVAEQHELELEDATAGRRGGRCHCRGGTRSCGC
mmetsp:Transcript_31517/g.93641  ORF Transcript_31517/g.93641 Transcript_31517/m.93641 type:complete len:254 (-) Transcript_31517:50-811(-)